MQLGNSVRPDVYEFRDVLGSRRQELACSPTMSALSVDAGITTRMTRRLQDEEDGEEICEEIIHPAT